MNEDEKLLNMLGDIDDFLVSLMHQYEFPMLTVLAVTLARSARIAQDFNIDEKYKELIEMCKFRLEETDNKLESIH